MTETDCSSFRRPRSDSGNDRGHYEVPQLGRRRKEVRPVYTENLIRIDEGGNRLTSAHNDRAVVFCPGRPGLAIQGEEPA
jgi:hypothetical protein